MHQKSCFMNEDRGCDNTCPAYSKESCRLLVVVDMAASLAASLSKALDSLVENVRSSNRTVYPKSAPPPEVK